MPQGSCFEGVIMQRLRHLLLHQWDMFVSCRMKHQIRLLLLEDCLHSLCVAHIGHDRLQLAPRPIVS